MLIINLVGLLLIVLIVWWFWLYKPKEVAVADDDITITVENGTYHPSRIKLPAGQEVTIRFVRKDPSPCSATVLIPKLEISEELALDKSTTIKLPSLEAGDYPFHCQMQMYAGTLLVE